MSPIIPSRYGHPKYNIFPQKSRATSQSGVKAAQRGTPGLDSKSRRKQQQRVEESKITVLPTEDEDVDNFFSKQLAAARFQRNHRLINILFSDIVVEQEQIPDNDKLQACKKRVKSLTDYQKRLDDEMSELNEKFVTKKARISDEGKKFAVKLNEFVVNSKKEIENLKVVNEAKRQQEAILRQQAPKKPEPAPTLDTDSSEKNKEDNNEAMDIVYASTTNTPTNGGDDCIQLVLSKLLDSVANAI